MPSSASDSPSRDISTVLAESELQWLYAEDELMYTPSVENGMAVDAERELRVKGVTFIHNVGGMLNVPQTTITTAAVYFHRFLMRYSLKPEPGRNSKDVLHHYQIAAVVLFVATKSEEHSRKLRDLVIACCRIAQKNHNLVVDEQTKDFWRWKDTIVYNEDLVLETLCFDLTIDSPYRLFFNLIKRYEVSQNKALRSSAWSFLNDSSLSILCLVFPSSAIAVFALLYGACKEGPVRLPDDEDGRPWWETEGVSKDQIHRAIALMADFYDKFPPKPGGNSGAFVGCLTDEKIEDTRLKRAQTPGSPDSSRLLSSYANLNDWDTAVTPLVKDDNLGSPRKRTPGPDSMELDEDERSQGTRAKRIKSTEPPGTRYNNANKKNGNGDMHDSGSGSEEGEIQRSP